MLLDPFPQLGHVLLAQRLGEHDRRPPWAFAVEREDGAHLVHHRLRGRVVQLVHGDHVRNLHDPGLQGLHRVARARHEHEQHRVGDADHLDLALTGAHGLDEDDVLSGRVEEEHGLQRGLGESPQVPARAHGADEDALVEEVVGETDPVAEERALAERARRVDRDHAQGSAEPAQVPDERADQAGLPHPGRAGHPHDVRAAGVRVEVADELVGERLRALDEGDRAGERAPVARPDALRELAERPLAPPRHGPDSIPVRRP